MNERNIIQGGAAVFLSQIYDVFYPLRWVMLAAIILILVDLRFGILAACKRGEAIRFSRAIRRTVNKGTDYICWILLAGTAGQAFGEPFGLPLLPLIMLLVIFGCEINSCYSNYFEAHGKKVKINIFKLFAKKTDIIEPEDSGNSETKNQ